MFNVSLIIISKFLDDIDSPSIMRSLKLQFILIIRNQEGPISELFCRKNASFFNIFFFFSEFFPVILCPVVGLKTEIRNNEYLSSKWRLFSLFQESGNTQCKGTTLTIPSCENGNICSVSIFVELPDLLNKLISILIEISS